MTQEAKEQITKLIMESYDKGVADTKQAAIEAIELAIKLEREACAKECEHTALRMGSEWMAQHCAEAIRARGEA
jgi:hypothetical protein